MKITFICEHCGHSFAVDESLADKQGRCKNCGHEMHVPSPEFARLRQLAQLSPEARPEVLAAIAPLVASGYYLTPEAARRTAGALIQAIEP